MLITLAHLSSVAHNQETFDLLAVKALQNFLKTVTSTWTHLRASTLKKNLSKYKSSITAEDFVPEVQVQG